MPMPQAPFISVVVTTYNRPDALAAVVEACFAQNRISTLKRQAPVALHHAWQPHHGFRASAGLDGGSGRTQ